MRKKTLLILSLLPLIFLTGCGRKFNPSMRIHSEEQFLHEMLARYNEGTFASSQALQSTNPIVRQVCIAVLSGENAAIPTLNTLIKNWSNGTYTGTIKPIIPSLYQFSGSKLDTEYLRGIINHHKDTVAMLHDILLLDPHDAVKTFAEEALQEENDSLSLIHELQRR